jgi:hypothetical protein
MNNCYCLIATTSASPLLFFESSDLGYGKRRQGPKNGTELERKIKTAIDYWRTSGKNIDGS